MNKTLYFDSVKLFFNGKEVEPRIGCNTLEEHLTEEILNSPEWKAHVKSIDDEIIYGMRQMRS